MNHATTYNIGNNTSLRRKKTKATPPTAPRIREVDGSHKRCTGNHKRQKEVSPDRNASNGFLKTTFLPKLKLKQPEEHSKKAQKLERDFYTSLSRLSAHYEFEPMESRELSYPYNMALSLWDAKVKLKNTVNNFDNLQLKTEKNKVFFVSEERCKIGLTLFYIPVFPLFLMLNDKSRRKTALLISSVFSYLYHIADIPYYRQEDSYLYWQYDMMNDWVEQDEENEYLENNKAELRQADYTGDKIEQIIYNRKTLTAFKDRLNRLKCNDEFDKQCLKMAKEAFALYEEFPQESIYRNVKMPDDENESDDEYETIPMEKYVSFWADSDSWLAENITDSVNSEFNEYSDVDEPTISKQFDGKPISGNSLKFESHLFYLLDELIYLLNTYKKLRNGHLK